MKTIEQKARAYDEALEKAKEFKNNPFAGYDGTDLISALFPELKESEDEKIRKALISFLKSPFVNENITDEKVTPWIAWLEKQGEQKPVDKVKLKFHEGDWVVSPNGVYWHIDKISNNRYEVTSNTGKGSGSWNLDTNIYHKFTIQDAKDGDVLSYRNGQWIFIYKGFGKEENEIAYYALLSNKGLTLNNYNYSVIESAFSPATKEERDTLEKAMSDAGYTFDFEKKELKKIEQKPADKVEPKFKVGDKIQYLRGCGTIMTIEKIENGEYIFGNNLGHTTIEDGNKWYLVECNPTWSEEDESILQGIWDEILANKHHAKEYEWKTYDKFLNWLKSLRPQNKWKPSEEQIKALEMTLYTNMSRNDERYSVLSEFVSELKKLRDE